MNFDVKRGDIWLVNLDPTIGHEINKTRPCVILQNNQGNKMSTTTIISPISSQNIDFIYPFEVLLLKKDSGLIKDSKINLAQIRVVDEKRLIKKIGKVNIEIIPQMNEAIKISLGITDF